VGSVAVLHAAGGALCVENADPWLASLPDAAWDMVPPMRRPRHHWTGTPNTATVASTSSSHPPDWTVKISSDSSNPAF